MNKIKETLKSLYADDNYFKILKELKNKNRKLILVGLPVHGNYGDHIIGCAERDFFNEYFPDFKLVELSMAFCNAHNEIIKENIGKNDIVCISGGGWMGDLYPHDEDFVRRFIREYRNKIIVFPQTVFYENEDSDYAKEGFQLLSQRKELLLFCRDKRSFDLCEKKGIPQNRLFLFPDMSLYYLNRINEYFNIRTDKSETIGMCFREDNEKVISQSLINIIQKTAQKKGFRIEKFTTDKNKYVKQKNKRKELSNLLSKIASYQLVFTDRLHAMVFSALVGTKCYFVDNRTKKVSGVFKWIEDIGYVRQIKNIDCEMECFNTVECTFSNEVMLENNEHFVEMQKLIWRFINE